MWVVAGRHASWAVVAYITATNPPDGQVPYLVVVVPYGGAVDNGDGNVSSATTNGFIPLQHPFFRRLWFCVFALVGRGADFRLLSTEEWEGPDAVQEAREDMRVTRAAASQAAKRRQPSPQNPPLKAEERESEPPSDESEEFNPEAEKTLKVSLPFAPARSKHV